jgi:small subunit ribosomal protein SAe
MPPTKSKTKGRKGKKGAPAKRRAAEKGVAKGRVRNTRWAGRLTVPERLATVLAPSEEDIKMLIAAKSHVGKKKAHSNMKRYIWKQRRTDGLQVINLQKTWYKLMLAARIIAAIKNPEDVLIISNRQLGQRGAIKFAHYTGATAHVSKWVPGTFSNPEIKSFVEPRLVIVDDPMTCFGALRETSFMGIPVIALANVDNNLRFVDCAIPCNNSGCLSLGLMFWMLAREVIRIRDKTIGADRAWDASVDLFFYRDPEKIKKQLEAKAAREREAQDAADADTKPLYGDEPYAMDEYTFPQQEYAEMGLGDLQDYRMDVDAGTGMEDWGGQEFAAPYEQAYGAPAYGGGAAVDPSAATYGAPPAGGYYGDQGDMEQW